MAYAVILSEKYVTEFMNQSTKAGHPPGNGHCDDFAAAPLSCEGQDKALSYILYFL